MWCRGDETRGGLASTQCPARLFSLLLLANIYFECLIWARPWVSVLLFVVKFVLMISPVIQVRAVMVAVGPMRKQAQKRQATCPRSQSQQAMGCSAVLPLVGTLTSAGPCFLPRCRVHSRPPRVSREMKCRNARSHQPLQGSLGM